MPPVPAEGVPESRPVELRLTPLGRFPVKLKVGVGKPVAVTVNEPNVPTVKKALLPLVMAGAWLTIKVNAWVASGLTPLLAVMVMG